MNVASYIRTSTKKQDLDSQRRAVEAWAAHESHEVTFFGDGGVSGRKADRAGIEALLSAVEKGDYKLVALTELSRLGRSLSHVHRTVERLATAGAKIVLVSGTTIDPTKLEGKALIGALALAAEVEWHLIQERNARGRETIKAKGIKVGRKRKEVSEAALRALREKNLSVRAIAKELRVSPATVVRRLRTLDAKSEAS